MDEATQRFAEALVEFYKAIGDRSVSAQELHTRLPQNSFDGVIDNLRAQAEANRAMSEVLVEQARRQQEASQDLLQESVKANMDLLWFMFPYRR